MIRYPYSILCVLLYLAVATGKGLRADTHSYDIPQADCKQDCLIKAIGQCEALDYSNISVHRVDNIICFSGLFDQASINGFWKNQVKSNDIIVARSIGGYVSAGLIIADMIAAKDVSVAVWDRCNSTCAIFLYIPAKRKYAPHALSVSFHSIHKPEWVMNDSSIHKAEKKFWIKEYNDTLALYNRIGVDPDIFDKPPENLTFNVSGENRLHVRWSYNKTEMQAYGVTGIVGDLEFDDQKNQKFLE